MERYYASTKYMFRKIAGEGVLVSVGEGVADFCGIVKLNASAQQLWITLQNGATKEELIQSLMETFSISEDKAKEDVEKSTSSYPLKCFKFFCKFFRFFKIKTLYF